MVALLFDFKTAVRTFWTGFREPIGPQARHPEVHQIDPKLIDVGKKRWLRTDSVLQPGARGRGVKRYRELVSQEQPGAVPRRTKESRFDLMEF